MMPQGAEWILIILAVFLLFGASKLPQLAKSLGQSKKAFKEGMREAEEEEKAEAQKLASPPPAAPLISQMSDEALAEELRKRSEAQAEH